MSAASVTTPANTEAPAHIEAMWGLSLLNLCVIDQGGHLVHANPAMVGLLGRSAEELGAAPMASFFEPEDIEAVTVAFAEGGQAPGTTHEAVLRYAHPETGIRWLRWSFTWSEGCFYAAAVDVTESRQAAGEAATRAAELEKLAEELARSNAELQSFAYTASHDLREPLRKVENYCQLISRKLGDDLDPKLEKYLNGAVGAARRMQAFIDALLDYSRVGKSEVRTPCSLKDVGELAVANLQMAIADRGAVVTVDEALPTIHGDPKRLEQLVQNLVSNALKFQKPDAVPTVDVVLEEVTDEHVTVAVRDNGIGIPEDRIHEVFEVFRRLHGRGEYEGTGIGLSTVKRIVETHGGRIWITSEVDVGTTFHFTLDATEPVAEATDAETDEAAA